MAHSGSHRDIRRLLGVPGLHRAVLLRLNIANLYPQPRILRHPFTEPVDTNKTRGSGVWLRYDLAFECEVGERVTTPPSINNDWLWPVLIRPSSLRPVPFERWRPADRSQPRWSLLASSDQNGSNIGHSKLRPRTKKKSLLVTVPKVRPTHP